MTFGSLPSLVASRPRPVTRGVAREWNLRRAPEQVVVHMSESPAGLMKGSNHAVGRHKNGVKEVVQLDQCMNNNHYEGGRT